MLACGFAAAKAERKRVWPCADINIARMIQYLTQLHAMLYIRHRTILQHVYARSQWIPAFDGPPSPSLTHPPAHPFTHPVTCEKCHAFNRQLRAWFSGVMERLRASSSIVASSLRREAAPATTVCPTSSDAGAELLIAAAAVLSRSSDALMMLAAAEAGGRCS